MAITSTKKINMSIYFEILMVGLQALYVFCVFGGERYKSEAKLHI